MSEVEETVQTEAPVEVDAATQPSEEQPSEGNGAPQWRVNEITAARRAAEDESRRKDLLLQQYERELQNLRATPPAQAAQAQVPSTDQAYIRELMAPILDPLLGEVRQMRQETERDKFFREYGNRYSEDQLITAEKIYVQLDPTGQKLSRAHALALVVGTEDIGRTSQVKDQAQARKQQVQQLNRVSHAESGSTTQAAAPKTIDDYLAMSPEEMMANIPDEQLVPWGRS